MGLQRLSAFVQGNGIFQVHLALLQAGDNGFQLFEGAFEAQLFDGFAGPFWACRFNVCLGGNGETPAVLTVSECTETALHHNRSYGAPKPASCPRTKEIIIHECYGTSSFVAEAVIKRSRPGQMCRFELQHVTPTALRKTGNLGQDPLQHREFQERFDPPKGPQAGVQLVRPEPQPGE